MNRREFLARMLAGGVVTAAGIWMPGEKLISIPSREFWLRPGAMAWFDGDVAFVSHEGKVIEIPEYFNPPIIGAELARGIARV